MSSREAILGRVRAALARPRREAARAARLPAAGRADAAARGSTLFCERVGDYRAEVRRVAAAELAAAIADASAERGARRVGVPRRAAAPPGVRRSSSWSRTTASRRASSTPSTASSPAARVAIAETGTIVLTAGPADGRRALTLVPDLHVCVVEEAQVVELVPEAIALLGDVRSERRPLTFVSGPSATSDIELSRVEGVHGPRTLVVIVAG